MSDYTDDDYTDILVILPRSPNVCEVYALRSLPDRNYKLVPSAKRGTLYHDVVSPEGAAIGRRAMIMDGAYCYSSGNTEWRIDIMCWDHPLSPQQLDDIAISLQQKLGRDLIPALFKP